MEHSYISIRPLDKKNIGKRGCIQFKLCFVKDNFFVVVASSSSSEIDFSWHDGSFNV